MALWKQEKKTGAGGLEQLEEFASIVLENWKQEVRYPEEEAYGAKTEDCSRGLEQLEQRNWSNWSSIVEVL